MRRTLMCSAVLLMAACGGDKSNGPSEPQFPEVHGIYHLTGQFDQVPASQANLTGTLTINQPSRDASTLNGNLTISLRTADDQSAFNGPLSQAEVSEQGDISFIVSDQSGSWSFTGHVFSDGSIGNGRHTLTGATSGSFSGSWQASK